MKKLFIILLVFSVLGLIGFSLAANPTGRTNPAEKAVSPPKPAPAGKNLPTDKSAPAGLTVPAPGDPMKTQTGDGQRQEAFKTSLHHTGRGLAFWYGKEQKGLELLTGQPYEKLACKQCHIGSCQGCHQPVKKTKGQADRLGPVDQQTCLKCHDRLAALQQQMREGKKEDVHAALGMTCLDCHTSREMHGDGRIYDSQKQPGAMDARCDRCHEEISDSYSHRKHVEKVSCQACHAHTVLSRTSTQFEILGREGKRVSVPQTDWVFLMNRGGELTAAGLESWVLPDGKTFMAFAPDGSHGIGKTGRKCGECHASPWMFQAQKGKVNLSWIEKEELKKGKGLVPVVEGVIYDLVHQKFENGKWTPLEAAGPATVQFAGTGGPVAENHFRKMLKVKSEKPEGKEKKKKK
ncbi:MAG: hypothetical protein HY892_08585 [Deltaproteobacteria bacterium]|nr:hypothetical protein [Deltaproteobacteria bacterium]